ncbi:hypothetical protein LINPERHAP2_LOCUS22663 [Linum perenne]
MQWLVSWGYTEVTFEVDAKELSCAVNRNDVDHSEFGCVVEKCRRILVEHHGFIVCVVRRDRNQVAHQLARHSPSLISPFVGFSSPNGMDSILNDICFDIFDVFAKKRNQCCINRYYLEHVTYRSRSG